MIRLLGGLIVILLMACNPGTGPHAENTQAALAAELPLPKQPELLPLDIRTACLLSQITYCTNAQEKLDSFLPGWKIAWYPKRVNSNHAFAATDGTQWAIAFRGSLMEISWEAFDNWINQDLNILTQVSWPHSAEPGARISQGAQNSFNNLNQLRDTIHQQTLTEFLSGRISTSSRILFTGHSLGGSLATVFASYLSTQAGWKDRDLKNMQVISFAAPAPGNKVFARDFDQKFPNSIRVESEGDIVARFPCTERVSAFARNCAPLPSADEIQVKYEGLNVSLRKAIETMALGMTLLDLKNGGGFEQVAGKGHLIKIKPKTGNDALSVENWFAAAGFQHGIAQYAGALDVPVISCP